MKKTISAIFIICLFIMMVSCKTKDPKLIYVPVEKTITVTETIRDTIIDVQLVPDKQSVITPSKDTSRLENKYCLSFAFWDGEKLFHNLNVKDTSVPTKVPIKEKKTVIVVPIIQPYEVKETIYVDKQDSWLDKTQKYIARIGLGLLAIFLLVKYRSRIFKFVRKWVFKA